MLKKLLSLFLLAVVFSVGAFAQAGQSEIKGKLVDSSTGEPLPFVNIILEKNGVQVAGGQSNFDGDYVIKPIPPGTYTLKASSVGFKPVMLTGIKVTSEEVKFVDVKLESTSIEMKEFVVKTYKNKLIDKGNTTVKQTVSEEDFKNMAVRSATEAAKNTAGVYSADDGTGNLNIRGARSDANYYYIDGMKVLGSSNLPKSAIGEISVISGGLPAQYGDVTGGVISITTKGPSAEYHGAAEYLSSGWKIGDKVVGLDPYGYNVIEGSLSGPLLMRKDSTGKKVEPIIGFFVSGNYTHSVDATPSSVGIWKVKNAELDILKANPVTILPGFGQTVQNAELLRSDSFEKVRTKQNVARGTYVLNGKLDINTGKTTNLTFGGSYNATAGNAYSYANSMYNSANNADFNNNDWRVFGRFVQRFGNNNSQENKSSISNAFYSIQVGYNETNSKSGDPTHGDNYFDYGYVGEFKRFQQRQYQLTNLDGDSLYLGAGQGWVTQGRYNVQQSFEDTLIGFNPSDLNPDMAAYTSNYYSIFGWEGYDDQGNPVYDRNKASSDEDGNGRINGTEANYFLRNQENVLNGGGYINGSSAKTVYGIWNSHAAVSNSASKSKNQQYRVSLMGSADIKKHGVSVGFEYEQRVIRGYSIAPRGLWTIGNLRMNSHLQNLDVMNPYLTNDQTATTVSYDRLNAAPGAYRGEINEDAQSFFDYNVRQNLGLGTDGVDFVDFNSLKPSELRLDFFSASELLNNGNNLVSYYGYDAYGNQTNASSSLNDFFEKTDDFGNYTRPVDAFRPNYVSGWIQDKYAFDDLVFNVGLRVDRLDLNQSVLKDEYVLFPTVKAGENEAQNLAGNMEGNYSIPSNVGSDYVVYVDNVKNPTAITGYRNGGTWYNKEGVEIASSDALVGSSGIAPLLVDKDKTRSSDITVNSFEDYTPQVNFMPRIAFSFPINDEALFFAHYDVLTRRPTAGGNVTAARLNIIDYYYMDASSNGILSNPNLKPSQTVDYAVGFKQVITGNSSVTLEAFYRELRDMVQVVGLQNAYPRTYMTYGNIDFGTVKGLILSYDLRRTKNIRITASYTLQFAAGTGSDAFSASNLVRSGKQSLRNTSPLNYDQRHNIVANFDYRFGMGKDWGGPENAKWLKGAGANFIFNLGSGTPYSRQNFVTGEGYLSTVGSATLQGSVNGSRLPWQFKMDLRIDKDLILAKESAHPMRMNVYLQMFNVLNSLNIRSVYRFTGVADDDGYLTDSRYQTDIQSKLDEQSFREQYSMQINNPSNYTLPRRTRIGVLVTF
tara:strand:+ start:10402 stop:14247 length:3846 start_codon:yes stop_codon:yes gene_type:complete